ncbi:MAG: hypothetical protein H0A76_06780 [Candidatus Thiodubiliella endoseptemdiera]|uniref:VOC domain-containing protein n=1 Tax=Candidatus Thiodubiliella endoseptemdiera TaxID=2738886 RepID=A0A853F7B8_9GAMM|nr:hypothetical protein [Candidatus Thiodubiliella endoseptemdiera]
MKKFHISIAVDDIDKSIKEYSKRLGCDPYLKVHDEYALWRTNTLNFSIGKNKEDSGNIMHIGWEDSRLRYFKEEIDINGITWEYFDSKSQENKINKNWKSVNYLNGG